MDFVDVTNDIAFRKIFGNENKKKALISFLNAVIRLPDDEQVVDVGIANPFQLGIYLGKNTILDVKAIDGRGNNFLVEMQVAKHEFFHKRVLYYTSQNYASQIEMGEDYKKLRPVYFIGILKYNFGQNPIYHCKHKVLDVATNEHLIKGLEFNFIELRKFTKTIDQLETTLDQWTYFIKHSKDLSVIPKGIKDEGLLEAYNEAQKGNWSKKEWEEYDKASMKEGDDKNRLEYAEKVSREEGIGIGKELVAINAIKAGFDNTTISKLTALSESQIDQLREELNNQLPKQNRSDQ